MPYILYATNKNGDGHVQVIGEYDDLSDISFRVEMFSKDVVITIEEKKEDE